MTLEKKNRLSIFRRKQSKTEQKTTDREQEIADLLSQYEGYQKEMIQKRIII